MMNFFQMNKIVYSLLFTLTACTAPIVDPPAHACSPRLDGKPTHCPTDLDDLKPAPPSYPQPKREINIFDPMHWYQLQIMLYESKRKKEIEKNMTRPEDSINKAVMEYQDGRNDTPKSEELLQLPSD